MKLDFLVLRFHQLTMNKDVYNKYFVNAYHHLIVENN